jgi:hypothetical protein
MRLQVGVVTVSMTASELGVIQTINPIGACAAVIVVQYHVQSVACGGDMFVSSVRTRAIVPTEL